MRPVLVLGVLLAIPVMGFAQSFEPLDVNGKLEYHIKQTVGPLAIVGDAAYAGILQEADTPTEWGQGGSGYGKRFASTAACTICRLFMSAAGFAFAMVSPAEERTDRVVESNLADSCLHSA